MEKIDSKQPASGESPQSERTSSRQSGDLGGAALANIVDVSPGIKPTNRFVRPIRRAAARVAISFQDAAPSALKDRYAQVSVPLDQQEALKQAAAVAELSRANANIRPADSIPRQ